MKNKYLWVGSIAAAAIILDQFTKYLVISRFRLFESITVVPGCFNLTYVRNPGAAFGILAGAEGPWRSVFFVSVTLVAMAVLVFLVRKTEDRLSLIAFALIGGGALGNLIDRIRFGQVVDFIEWYVRSYHWPTFNVADSAISAGVVLLAIDMLFRKEETTVEKTKSEV